MQHQIYDGLTSGVVRVIFVFAVTLIKLFSNVLVYLTAIRPFDLPSSDVKKSIWAHFSTSLVILDLGYYYIGS